jgi:hypothetical protein
MTLLGTQKHFWEGRVMHGASERFWPRFFRAEAVSLTIVTACTVQVLFLALGLRTVVLLVVLVTHLVFQPHAWMTQPVVG